MRPERDFGTLGNMRRLLILTSAAAMIGMAAPAYADDPPSGADADFITQLKAAGLTHQDPAKAVTVAKDMCTLVDNGTPDTDIESNLVKLNPGLTAHGADEFMALAAGEYCPKYLPKYMTGQGWTTKPSGAEANKPPSPQGNQPPGPEANNPPGPGANNPPGPGANNPPGPGANNPPGPEGNQPPGPEGNKPPGS